MTPYVDVHVIPVPRARLEEYRKLAVLFCNLKKEHGALSCLEIVEEDVQPGVHTSFPQALKLAAGEVVLVAITTFTSRAERDRINAAVMADPRCTEAFDMSNMPLDPKRMFWGGFTTLVSS